MFCVKGKEKDTGGKRQAFLIQSSMATWEDLSRPAGPSDGIRSIILSSRLRMLEISHKLKEKQT